MSDVTRDEFDRLVDRVTRIERTQGALGDITASEVVGLRTYLDERFAAVDERFAAVDERFARIELRLGVVEEGMTGLTHLVENVRDIGLQQDRKVEALLLHFHVDPDDPAD
jgi:hypothetical protein